MLRTWSKTAIREQVSRVRREGAWGQFEKQLFVLKSWRDSQERSRGMPEGYGNGKLEEVGEDSSAEG